MKKLSPLNAAHGKALQRLLQKETGHRYTPTSGQEAVKLYRPRPDSKAARADFCETRQECTAMRVPLRTKPCPALNMHPTQVLSGVLMLQKQAAWVNCSKWWPELKANHAAITEGPP